MKFLIDLMRSLQEGRISVKDFCERYEEAYNFKVNKSEIPIEKRGIFDHIFSIVAWYSPFPEERDVIPNYKDENAVLTAVQEGISSILSR